MLIGKTIIYTLKLLSKKITKDDSKVSKAFWKFIMNLDRVFLTPRNSDCILDGLCDKSFCRQPQV